MDFSGRIMMKARFFCAECGAERKWGDGHIKDGRLESGAPRVFCDETCQKKFVDSIKVEFKPIE